MTRSFLIGFIFFAGSMNGLAQGRGGGRGAAPPTARSAAPFDMTGYWVSVISEDWRWRMFPNRGDWAGIPLNGQGQTVAGSWDPAKDEAAGEQCKGYGAPGLMKIPGRFHITWQDDQTLRIEADAGRQVRTLHFGAVPAEGGNLQGTSKAEWEFNAPTPGFAIAGGARGGPQPGSLRVTTTNLRSGYLRKNGVPYSANARLTEYYDLVNDPTGIYLVLVTTLEDPTYLTQPWITAVHFKKQADAAGWNPAPCASR